MLLMKKLFPGKACMVLIGCLILGVFISSILLYSVYVLNYDDCVYARLGKNLADGAGYAVWGMPHIHHPPLFPLAIALLYKITGNLELAGSGVSMLSFIISIVLFFKLTGFIYNERAACFATFLFVNNGLILWYSYRITSHSLDIMLVLTAVFLACIIIKNNTSRRKHFVFPGIVLGLAILNRAENIILSLAIIIALIAQVKVGTRKKITAIAALIIVCSVTLLPYAIFLHKYTGKWAITTKMRIIGLYEYMINNDDPLARQKRTPAEAHEFSTFKYIKENGKNLTIRYSGGIGLFTNTLSRVLFAGFGYLFIGLGLFGQPWNEERKRIEPLLFLCLAQMAIIPLSNVWDRYFLAVVPIFLLWMGKGFDNLTIFLKSRFGGSSRKTAVIITVILAFFLLSTGHWTVKQIKAGVLKPEHKNMGLWMKENIPDITNKRIGALVPATVFYSGAQAFAKLLCFEKYSEFMHYVKKHKVDYIIIGERAFSKDRPQFAFLLEDEKKHPGLAWIHTIKGAKKIILYKVE